MKKEAKAETLELATGLEAIRKEGTGVLDAAVYSLLATILGRRQLGERGGNLPLIEQRDELIFQQALGIVRDWNYMQAKDAEVHDGI